MKCPQVMIGAAIFAVALVIPLFVHNDYFLQVIFDEPSLGLAPKLVEEVFQKVRQIGEKGVTVMVVEQNVVDGLSVSKRGYVVENGAVILHGPSEELLNNAQVRAAYLGL